MQSRNQPVSLIAQTFALLLVTALMLAWFRTAFLWHYADPSGLRGLWVDISQAYWLGLRFDLKLASIAALVCLLPGFALASLGKRFNFSLTKLRYAGIWLWFFLIALLATIEHFYFGFYQTPFSPTVLGFVEDDTVNILRTVWQDYPFLRALAAVLVLAWGACHLTIWLSGKFHRFVPRSGLPKLLAGSCFLLALLLLARGSLAMFPLSKEDAWFSTNPILNHVVRNSVHSLHDAWVSRQEFSIHINSAEEGLQAAGFKDAYQAALVATGKPLASEDEIAKLFWQQAPASNTRLRPHIVFSLMESWGGYMQTFDHPLQTDLLGRMREHSQQDIWLKNVLPSMGATHAALEALLINTPIVPLTTGKFRKNFFSSTVTWPLKHAGYKTVLVYGGSLQWHDLRESFTHQGFDALYDQADIKSRFPQTLSNDWGVLDEYLFRFALDELQTAEKNHERLFLFVLTTTNHSPFQLPFDRFTQIDKQAIQPHIALAGGAVEQVVQTYRYASDQLGAFVSQIKQSPMREHTLIAATGDHNMRYAFRFQQPSDLFDIDRVAAYLYVPHALRPKQDVDLSRYYSHQDLFPTLLAIALPANTPYFAGGESIFQPQRSRDWAHCWYSGVYMKAGYATGSWQSPSLYQWGTQRNLSALGEATAPSIKAELTTNYQKAIAWHALQDWSVRRLALQGGKAP